MRKLKKKLCSLNADYNIMYYTVVIILSAPMYPLNSVDVPLGVHVVPQVGNPWSTVNAKKKYSSLAFEAPPEMRASLRGVLSRVDYQ